MPHFFRTAANTKLVFVTASILPNKIIFAMSKKEINLYDFANYFKSIGCKNALYLDGFVSRTYLPEKNWIQTDGDFGVIIGVTTNE
ncbi:phosphodiester glycosidase family protein [Pinibacter soli]|uniref:Phosphodiester glycosidase family protein n=1 Tax=Pinibacter soli TaxID=3044211 RepID=A0ABT6RHR6_9BACT|nr:phosphodiester glycosidase family protein [Pinibacter soli]MDI3322021.1 phosphodiester glycosidase family protein [Pinibacter soli]